MDWLIYLAFLPVFLIVLLIKVIYHYSTKNSKLHTKMGAEVIICKKCGQHLITSEDYFSTSTRVVCTKQEMLNLIEPVLELIREENIIYEIVKAETNVVEDLKIKYTNKNNGKTILTEIYVKDRSFVILCDGTEFKYSHKNYAYLIIKKLDYSLSHCQH